MYHIRLAEVKENERFAMFSIMYDEDELLTNIVFVFFLTLFDAIRCVYLLLVKKRYLQKKI